MGLELVLNESYSWCFKNSYCMFFFERFEFSKKDKNLLKKSEMRKGSEARGSLNR